MIKLKDILKEAGLLSEQATGQVVEIQLNTTEEQLRQQLQKLELSKPITIRMNVGVTLADNKAPDDAMVNKTAEKIQMLLKYVPEDQKNNISVIVSGTTSDTSATKDDDTAKPTDKWSQWIINNQNAIQPTDGYSNQNLAIKRAARMVEAAVNGGVPNTNVKIGKMDLKSGKYSGFDLTAMFVIPPLQPERYLVIHPRGDGKNINIEFSNRGAPNNVDFTTPQGAQTFISKYPHKSEITRQELAAMFQEINGRVTTNANYWYDKYMVIVTDKPAASLGKTEDELQNYVIKNNLKNIQGKL